MEQFNTPNPFTLTFLLASLALLPFFIVMGTSFVKLSIVFSLLRNALGIQQIPPNMALHGLCLILTVYIMAPVGFASYEAVKGMQFSFSSPLDALPILEKASVPYKRFLHQQTSENMRDFFMESAEEVWGEDYQHHISTSNFAILLPAFTVQQLTEAFEVGFLIYLPFIAIDLIISNILLAMGMMMVSPMTISLPFKLLLFVFLDGWSSLIQALILSYTN